MLKVPWEQMITFSQYRQVCSPSSILLCLSVPRPTCPSTSFSSFQKSEPVGWVSQLSRAGVCSSEARGLKAETKWAFKLHEGRGRWCSSHSGSFQHLFAFFPLPFQSSLLQVEPVVLAEDSGCHAGVGIVCNWHPCRFSLTLLPALQIRQYTEVLWNFVIIEDRHDS